MTDKLKVQFPTLGWEQIMAARGEMLDAFDTARIKAKSHKAKVNHGKVAEAKFREWLTNFLPKRYAVTSGYVISPGLGSREKTPHFDVIVYDQQESPVLWVDESPDTSFQGRVLAIPVEYVYAVLEIKSSLSVATIKDALEHLGGLLPLMDNFDSPGEKYKLYLPQTFCCGCVFYELREEDARNANIVSSFINGMHLRGFFGGMVLRSNQITEDYTGRISLTIADKPVTATQDVSKTPLYEIGIAPTMQMPDGRHIGAILQWSEAAFSQFAFDLLAIIQGRYDPNRVSSFYGMGSSFAETFRDFIKRP